jgi:hypothetical protein
MEQKSHLFDQNQPLQLHLLILHGLIGQLLNWKRSVKPTISFQFSVQLALIKKDTIQRALQQFS